MRALHKNKMIKLETTIDCLQSDLTQEKEAREEGEVQIVKLSSELEKAEQELKSLKSQLRDDQTVIDRKNKENITKLKEQHENLTAENFEYAVENVSVRNNFCQAPAQLTELALFSLNVCLVTGIVCSG